MKLIPAVALTLGALIFTGSLVANNEPNIERVANSTNINTEYGKTPKFDQKSHVKNETSDDITVKSVPVKLERASLSADEKPKPKPKPKPKVEKKVETPVPAHKAKVQKEEKSNESHSKKKTISYKSGKIASGKVTSVKSSSPKDYARTVLKSKGMGNSEFQCLNKLWTKESGWNHKAENPSSGAYGIPQALPGSKMASKGSDWSTNYETQIDWGLSYISERYGTPCNAWGHSVSKNWY